MSRTSENASVPQLSANLLIASALRPHPADTDTDCKRVWRYSGASCLSNGLSCALRNFVREDIGQENRLVQEADEAALGAGADEEECV